MRARRRTIVLALAAWVVVLFAAGAVWRATHPSDSEPAVPPEPELVSSQQAGYYACLNPPAGVRLVTTDERKAFLRRTVPDADQTAALRGCHLALRK